MVEIKITLKEVEDNKAFAVIKSHIEVKETK